MLQKWPQKIVADDASKFAVFLSYSKLKKQGIIIQLPVLSPNISMWQCLSKAYPVPYTVANGHRKGSRVSGSEYKISPQGFFLPLDFLWPQQCLVLHENCQNDPFPSP